MTVKSIRCNSCDKQTGRWIIVVDEKEIKARWCRNCSIRSGINFELEHKKQVAGNLFLEDRRRIKEGLPPK